MRTHMMKSNPRDRVDSRRPNKSDLSPMQTQSTNQRQKEIEFPDAAVLKDPVCGMTASPASKHHYVYAGKPYFFCSEDCRNKFAANPGTYLRPAIAPPKPVAET